MSKPRQSAALVVGVFLGVIAVVIGATAVHSWGSHDKQGPAAAAHRPVNSALAINQAADRSPGGLASQIPDTSVAAMDDALHTRAGQLVARGHDFTIEKVALTKPTNVTVRGTTISATSVYRIVLTAGPYQMRDMPNVVSLNGRALAVGMESADLKSLMAFTFDDSVLTQGAKLQVSYGKANPATTTWTGTVEVVK